MNDHSTRGLFIFIESNTTGTGRVFVEKTIALNLKPVIVCKKPDLYDFMEIPGLTVISADTDNLHAILQNIRHLSPIKGVYSSSEYYIKIAAETAQALSLWHPNPQAIDNCRNKYLQAQILKDAGIAVPTSILVENIEQIEDIAQMIEDKEQQLTYPVVVKPISGSGSVNVRLCTCKEELLDHARVILSAKVNERGCSQNTALLVQAYEDGQEYSAEFLGLDMMGITKKHLGVLPWFVETGHDFPESLPLQMKNLLIDFFRKALWALGLTQGPSHIEFRLKSNGEPVLIEVNPRLAGGFIPRLMELTGIDIITKVLQRACSTYPTWESHNDCSSDKTKCSSIVFILKDQIKHWKTMASIAPSPHDTLEWAMYPSRLNDPTIYHDFRDRIGYVLCAGQSTAETRSRCEETIRRLCHE